MVLRGIFEAMPAKMSSSQSRDLVTLIARTQNNRALALAKEIPDPWFRAQALAAVAADGPRDRATVVTSMSFDAASKGHDQYTRAVARVWPIRALIQQGYEDLAREELHRARRLATGGDPRGSQGQALLHLMSLAITLGAADQRPILNDLASLESRCDQWRVRRALVDAIGRTHPDNRELAKRLATAIKDPQTRRKALRRLEQAS